MKSQLDQNVLEIQFVFQMYNLPVFHNNSRYLVWNVTPWLTSIIYKLLLTNNNGQYSLYSFCFLEYIYSSLLAYAHTTDMYINVWCFYAARRMSTL